MGQIFTCFLTFSLKVPKLHKHPPLILALFRSRPPWVSPSHSWGRRGYLSQNFGLFNLTFRTCNLEVKNSGFSLDKFFKVFTLTAFFHIKEGGRERGREGGREWRRKDTKGQKKYKIKGSIELTHGSACNGVWKLQSMNVL